MDGGSVGDGDVRLRVHGPVMNVATMPTVITILGPKVQGSEATKRFYA
jgi:hypothetical protein